MSAEQDLADANVKIANLIAEVTRFRDAAMGLNAIYPTITEGRQAVGDGKYFSVPGSGAYMRLYRRQGTSAEPIAEFPDRAELNNVLDQLGPLLGRGVVGGTGDLMARGFGGIGTDSAQTDTGDLYDLADSGLFFPVAQPNSIINSASLINICRAAGNRRTQLFIDEGTPINVVARNYNSGRSAGNEWSRPASLYHNENIVGVVNSQGGINLGAAIEWDSNSDGECIRFAGGVMICYTEIVSTVDINIPIGNLFRSDNLIPPQFPRQFAGTRPKITTDYRAITYTNVWGASAGGGTTTRPFDSYRLMCPVSITGREIVACITAIGRWY